MLSQSIKLIDFDQFYREKIHNTIMDSIYAYSLFEEGKINLRNREVKQLFVNFVTYYLIKHQPAEITTKEVFVIFPDILREDNIFNNPNMCICEYVDISALRKCLKPVLKSLSRSHPDLIFWSKRDTFLTNPDLVAHVFHSIHQFKR